MKNNYKPTEKVRITKPGTFNELEGSVTSIHPDKNYKPLVIDLGVYGTWSFNHADVEPLKKENVVYPFDEVKTKTSKVVKPKISKGDNKPKRAYNRKSK